MILLLSMHISAFATKVTSISIYGIRGIDISENLAASLQEHLESNLCKYGNYEVVSRNDLDKVMRENTFQNTGACFDQNCLVRAGHILGVREIITGTVSKVGQTYNIVLKLITVETGTIRSSVNQQYAGTVDSLLFTAESALVRLLLEPGREAAKVDTVIIVDTVHTVNTVVRTDTVWTVPKIPSLRKEVEPRHVQENPLIVNRTADPRLAKRIAIGAGLIFASIALVILINSNW
jgi:TolB-like protein